MPAKQPDATTYNPNQLNLLEIATYSRLIHASLERVWENVLDWEHLPWLHKSSFDYIELIEAGDWGWRTWSNPDHTNHVELTRATEDSYVARTYQGDTQIIEIWTTLTPVEDETEVSVRFYFPDVDESALDNLATYIVTLYTRLWDEDEAMMIERHQRLHEKRDTDVEIVLGEEQELRRRLDNGQTITFQLARREYQLRQLDGSLIAHSTICPHLLGPLIDAESKDGTLFCPWHGYQFDIVSGDCVYPEHASCHLAAKPSLAVEAGLVIARANA